MEGSSSGYAPHSPNKVLTQPDTIQNPSPKYSKADSRPEDIGTLDAEFLISEIWDKAMDVTDILRECKKKFVGRVPSSRKELVRNHVMDTLILIDSQIESLLLYKLARDVEHARAHIICTRAIMFVPPRPYPEGLEHATRVRSHRDKVVENAKRERDVLSQEISYLQGMSHSLRSGLAASANIGRTLEQPSESSSDQEKQEGSDTVRAGVGKRARTLDDDGGSSSNRLKEARAGKKKANGGLVLVEDS